MAFPVNLDSFGSVVTRETIQPEHLNLLRRAVEALEASVGITGSTDTNSLRYLSQHPNIVDFMHLTPLAAPPGTPVDGDVYVGIDNHMYCYMNTAWRRLDN